MSTKLVSFCLILVSISAINCEFVSSEQWAIFKADDGYEVRNDIWGSGHGTQTLHATSHNSWWIHANHPNTGGVKSYAHVAKNVGKKISALKSVSSSFSVTAPKGGAYETAYDIWCDNNKYEIMLWFNQQGAVGPIGGSVAQATIGGHSWDVHKGTNGQNEVFSFVIKGQTSSSTVDILAILKWIKEKGWFGDVVLGEVQFGFEITSSAGGLDFHCNKFSVNSS